MNSTPTFIYARPPPSTASLLSTFSDAYGLPARIYQDPFYSNPVDLPNRPVEVAAGYSVIIPGTGLGSLAPWETEADSYLEGGGGGVAFDRPQRSPLRPSAQSRGIGSIGGIYGKAALPTATTSSIAGMNAWTYTAEPPGRVEIRRWLEEHPVTIATSQGPRSAKSHDEKARKAAFRSQVFAVSFRLPQGIF